MGKTVRRFQLARRKVEMTRRNREDCKKSEFLGGWMSPATNAISSILILKVVTVSMETQKIVVTLPKLEF